MNLEDRTELRFILPSADQFLQAVQVSLREVRFSDNPYVQTLYFNNDEHVVPFNVSLKARRYLATLGLAPQPHDTFILEFKRSEGDHSVKERAKLMLAAAPAHFRVLCPTPPPQLRPYTMTEYLRRHYSPGDPEQVRVTIDTNVRYCCFAEAAGDAIDLGTENYARIEVKISDSAAQDAGAILRALEALGAFPVTSKKYASYTFLKRRREELFGRSSFFQEVGDLELEAKLEADPEQSRRWLFMDLKRFFATGDGHPFRLASEYPYTHETASINRYYRDATGTFKVVAKGERARIIRKSAISFRGSVGGVACIARRHEQKGDRVLVWDEGIRTATLLGELHRKRRAFWIEHVESHRIFHVSLDECRHQTRYLFQVEIEYTGGYETPMFTGEDRVIDELKTATEKLCSAFVTLKPTQITKEDWLAAGATRHSASEVAG